MCNAKDIETLFFYLFAPTGMTGAEGTFCFIYPCLSQPPILVSDLLQNLPQLNVKKLVQNAYYLQIQIIFEFQWTLESLLLCLSYVPV